jgi:acyl carrier protein
MDNVDKLCTLIQQNIGESHGPVADAVRPDTPLLVSGLLDSLTIMKIITQIERESGVSLPETSIVAANFRTPASLWRAVQTARVTLPRQNVG